MINHFNSDSTVKQQWPEALTAETLGSVAHIHFSNSIQTIPLEPGEQVGESFIAAIAATLSAAHVEPVNEAPPIPQVTESEVAAAEHVIEQVSELIHEAAAVVHPDTAIAATESAHAVLTSLHSQSVPIIAEPIAGATSEVIPIAAEPVSTSIAGAISQATPIDPAASAELIHTLETQLSAEQKLNDTLEQKIAPPEVHTAEPAHDAAPVVAVQAAPVVEEAV